jgi:hypothetical protein
LKSKRNSLTQVNFYFYNRLPSCELKGVKALKTRKAAIIKKLIQGDLDAKSGLSHGGNKKIKQPNNNHKKEELKESQRSNAQQNPTH